MAKKGFNTPMEEDLADKFRGKCREKGLKQTDVIEALFTAFVNGDIDLETKVILTRDKK